MGNNGGQERNRPQHKVELPNFQMGRYLVTVEEFREFIEETNYYSLIKQFFDF